MVLFTPAFHQTTLTDASGTEIVVRRGRVVEVREQAGSTPIPADGFVLSAKGASREWAREHLRRRTKVKVSAALKPAGASAGAGGSHAAASGDRGAGGAANPWSAAEDVVGGGPKIVTAGRVDITLEREKVLPSFSTTRHPRTAIASLPGNKALLVVVDGRQPALSVGMSLDELARLMIELGAVEAINLDGGGSSTMTIDGKVVNHPSDVTGERPVSDAILVLPARPSKHQPTSKPSDREARGRPDGGVRSAELTQVMIGVTPGEDAQARGDSFPNAGWSGHSARSAFGGHARDQLAQPVHFGLPVAGPAREQFRRGRDVLRERQHVDDQLLERRVADRAHLRLARKLAEVEPARVGHVGHGLGARQPAPLRFLTGRQPPHPRRQRVGGAVIPQALHSGILPAGTADRVARRRTGAVRTRPFVDSI